MSKRISRSKRKEQREKGVYEPPARVSDGARAAERRAEQAAASARAHAARNRIAEEEEEILAAPKAEPRRDRTLLVLIGLTALAGLIFWLTQRSPAKNETKIDVGSTAATSTAKP